ncbi:hypothetical protein TYRP_011641 [Tyrophagus putrescentiae]|nr:hypothetical protein TYRP_011641 [Tyrophagus putrescentiae]
MVGILRYAARSLAPLKTLQDLQSYFYYSSVIASKDDHQWSTVAGYFHLANGLILYRALFVLWIFLHPSTSTLEQFTQADILYILLPKSTFNLLALPEVLMAAYNVHVLYFAANRRLNDLLEAVLLKGDSSFFISPVYEGKKGQRSVGVMEVIKANYDACIRLFFLMTTTINCLLIYVYVHFGLRYREILLFPCFQDDEDEEGSSNFFFLCYFNLRTLALHLFNSVAFWTAFYTLTCTGRFFILTSVVFIRILQLKIRQLNGLLAEMILSKSGSQQLNSQRLAFYKRHFLQTLGTFFQGRRQLSRLFLALLLANCPSNVWMINWIFHGQVEGTAHQLFILGFIFYQAVAIFGYHLLYASTSRCLHSSARLLLSLMAQNGSTDEEYFYLSHPNLRRKYRRRSTDRQRKSSLSVQMTLHSLISAFHVALPARYGFTYGANFGLVTLSAFTRYVLLYGKFLLITHKWIRLHEVY